MGGGEAATKAERVSQLVLPGVRTCAPLEEGILYTRMEGLVAQLLDWGWAGVHVLGPVETKPL